MNYDSNTDLRTIDGIKDYYTSPVEFQPTIVSLAAKYHNRFGDDLSKVDQFIKDTTFFNILRKHAPSRFKVAKTKMYQELDTLTEGYMCETFINALFDDEKKQRYVDQVWDILQNSYKSIGGIKGSGFDNKLDMIKKIPFWKLYVKNNTVYACILYKDKSGRKSVVNGTNGTEMGKKALMTMFRDDLTRAYGEKSKGALGTLLKIIPEELISEFVIDTNTIIRTIDKNIIPLTNIPKDQWPEDAVRIINKYPYIEPYGYMRKIGNSMVFKVMIGKAHLKIV